MQRILLDGVPDHLDFHPDQNSSVSQFEIFPSCSRVWDARRARIETCALPYISTIPAIFAVCLLLGTAARAVSGKAPRPAWTRPFVEESCMKADDISPRWMKSKAQINWLLFGLTGLGLVSQAITNLINASTISTVLCTCTWLASCLIVVLNPSKAAPISFLWLQVSLFAASLISVVESKTSLGRMDVPAILAIILSAGTIAFILRMPLRDPRLSKDGISPPFGPPTSGLRSPEDDLNLWQFMTVSWMSPLISLGSSRKMGDEDIWNLGYEFQHRNLYDRFRELHGSVIRRLLYANGTDLIIISLLGILALLAEYSGPVLLQQILKAMEAPHPSKRAAAVYALLSLIIRLIAAQSGVFSLWYSRRAYERSRGELITMLHEKTLSRKIVGLRSKETAPIAMNGGANGHKSTDDGPPGWRLAARIKNLFRRKPQQPESAKDPASTGKILHLMRSDAYDIAQRFWDFPTFVTTPLGLIVSVVLIWKLIGWSCLVGVFSILIAQVANALLAQRMAKAQRRRKDATDVKLKKTTQLVDSIRHLRWYAWQNTWLKHILDARQHELNIRIIVNAWNILIQTINNLASLTFPAIAFYAYTVLAGNQLRIDIAFPALQLFTMLEESLRGIPELIQMFLNARISLGRIETFMNEPDIPETKIRSDSTMSMHHASFAWPETDACVLKDIDISFEPGVTLILGEVASGKSALLQALLGELDPKGGEYSRPGEMMAYCAQTPWLQSMSIRDNILFASPYEEARYKQTLDACALIPDMANFKNGDLSLIGENGIGLSGGQKARVALARAVYSRAKFVLLDDPLSALDYQTAEAIVKKSFTSSLLDGRTVVLVTHRTELCLQVAKKVIQMEDGKSRTLPSVSLDLERIPSTEEVSKLQEEAAVPDKFIEDEFQAHGVVRLSVYWQYIKAGGLRLWFLVLWILAFFRLIGIGRTWFLKQWGEAYDKVGTQLFDDLPSPEDDVWPWLIGFLIFAIAQTVTVLSGTVLMLTIVYQAAKRMFNQVMNKVAHAKFRYYDVTPVGRLMNRLTSDINTVDGPISSHFQVIAYGLITWVTSLIVIGSATPAFLVLALLLTGAFIATFMRFLPTSQNLRRLEMVSLSPLMSNFGALSDGLATIRAYCAQSQFQDRVIMVTDNFQKMDHFYWSIQSWLMYRFESISSFSTFALTLVAISTNVSAGLTAFVLSAASQFITSTHGLCRQYGRLQMDFASVERVVEMLEIDQEPSGTTTPPARWPSATGDIVFENVTIRYAPNLDPALENVTVNIKGGSTTALIGRTGSGKSTLALSLLATVIPENGRILIDGIDVSKVDTHALRSRVTFLAQEPVLFPGTMRANLDPLEEYADSECEAVLDRIAARHKWTLQTEIDASGKNLSQGQRQLVGLARALLRRSSVIIMDEATASIDMDTAMTIQQILREEMKESTVITIAHRVEAVKNADYYIVLGKGKLVEEGLVANMKDSGESYLQ